MGFTVERLNDTEPIVVFTYSSKLTLDVFKDAIVENTRFIEEIGEPIYIIADVRELESTFLDMLHIMEEAGKDDDGSANDKNIKMLILVGSSSFIKMYRNTMQKRGAAFGITIFQDVETAIDTARINMTYSEEES